ncbi:MAG: FAD-binding oxidoreductase [Candidatus Omnitrophica bacterium]|nr:FAD-binding oxidoreductase [Candidatus Omnitrophota bacterium]MBU4332946.1 FAD-binding oxidoreductase [Candidatus Omnitrophota bacterium]
MIKDYLIVGQGLAGSFLSWNLLKRNKSIIIVDQNHKNCSSLAAAGMINPITGKRLVLSQRCEELLPYAKEVYHELERHFKKKFFESKDIIRLFNSEQELDEWEKKSQQTHLKKYYGKKQDPGTYEDSLNDEKGSFVIQQGGYCRKLDLLNCFTDYFKINNLLVSERFDYDDLKIKEDFVEWKGESFGCVVFCEGYQAQDNPWFSWLPYNHAKGEILTVSNKDSFLPDAVISCGKWCIPIGDGKYTVGSTYSWDKFDCKATDEAKEEILREIGVFIKASFEVAEHMAGVRPIMKDLNPAMGRHPEFNSVAIFNGLASKGLILGPFYSNQMAEYLVGVQSLEKEVSIDRFIKKHF